LTLPDLGRAKGTNFALFAGYGPSFDTFHYLALSRVNSRIDGKSRRHAHAGLEDGEDDEIPV